MLRTRYIAIFIFGLAIFSVLAVAVSVANAHQLAQRALPRAATVTVTETPLADSPTPTGTALHGSTATATATASGTPGPGCGEPWTVQPAPTYGASNELLDGVDGVAENDVWAVGRSFYYYPGPSQVIIQHWNGTDWNKVPAQNPDYDNSLGAVAAISANDVWAVGFHGTYPTETTLTMHWDGSAWSIVPSADIPGENAYLTGVTALASNDVWAVGFHYSQGGNAHGTLVEHWDGGAWSIVPSPDPASAHSYLYSISAVSPNDIWAVGYSLVTGAGEQAFTMHWDGTAWTIVPSATIANSNTTLYGVSATGPNDVWAAGGYYATGGTMFQRYVEHWDGHAWSVVHAPDESPNDALFYAITAVAPNDVWAAGYFHSADMQQYTLVEHWNGTSWTRMTTPSVSQYHNYLNAISAISPSYVVGAGDWLEEPSNMYKPLLLHYQGDFSDVHEGDTSTRQSSTSTATGPSPATQTPPSGHTTTRPGVS